MKSLTFLASASASLALLGSAQGALIISEIVDGNRIASDGSAGTSPDPFLAFVELTNTGPATVDLTGFDIINFNNGASDANYSSTPLTGSLAVGGTFFFAYESVPDVGETSAFERTYGFAPDQFAGSKFINGDDVILLLDTPYGGGNAAVDTGTIVDTYGVLGVDGSGEVWDYLDTSASRNSGVTTGTSTFNPSEWTFNAPNSLDGGGAAEHQAQTSVVPEPSIALLGGLGLLGLIRRRRA